MINSIIELKANSYPVVSISDKIQIFAALGTFVAVFVALFQERIKQLFIRTKLKLQINLTPPDCHQIDLTNVVTSEFICKCIYLRIRVSNIGRVTANNVELIASNLWRLENNERDIVRTFLPMNLRWSHTHPTKITIPNGSFRFCDLGPISYLEDSVSLKFDMETQPNKVSGDVFPNVIPSGTYVLELLMAGDNVVAEKTSWILTIPDSWSDDEATMLDRIKISRI